MRFQRGCRSSIYAPNLNNQEVLQVSDQINITRRHILKGGAAVAAVSLPIVRATSQVTTNSQSLSGPGHQVDVLAASMPGFRQEMERLYPGLAQDDRFKQLYPLATLVRVSQGPAVRALSIVWNLKTTDGNFSAPVYFSAPPGTSRGPGKSRTVVTAQVDILQPGAYKLFTPYFSWTPEMYSAIAPSWPSVVQKAMPANFLATQVANATAVTVSLDGLIFNDRMTLGPDVNQLVDRIRVRRNAEHDETGRVAKMLKDGASDEEVVQYLSLKSTSSRPDGSGSRRWYRLARRQQAQRLLRKKTNLRPETFSKHVLRITAIKKTLFRRLSTES